MDFDLSKPQKMLQDSVKEFLSRHCTLERVRELMETPTAVDDELWEGLTDQGSEPSTWWRSPRPWAPTACPDRLSPTCGRPR